ncbi:hypothetical protein Tsp_10999 [Trichinella spiralis]|uniref:hypothetical protein n=1 Tax=Trichinella spiralis TaxID=6334 RepID=UPI0001EFC007|nr:hypothetical protein Tsp_10999 [Trichinella spiralis]
MTFQRFIIRPKLNTIRWKLCSIFNCVGPFGGRLRHHETSTSGRRRPIRHPEVLFHRRQAVLMQMNNTTANIITTNRDVEPVVVGILFSTGNINPSIRFKDRKMLIRKNNSNLFIKIILSMFLLLQN